MAPDRVRFALVGTSGHASRVAAPALQRCADTLLLGACGSQPDRGAAFAARHGLPRAYASLDRLLADPEVDAVWICSPNHLHGAQAIRCAEAGKHVLVDKPLATSEADAAATIDAARRTGIVLRVGYQHRFRPAHRRLFDLLRAGVVGDVGIVRVHRCWRYPYYADMEASPWRWSAAASGGWVINDLGSHLIDLMLWLTGLQARVIGAALASQAFAVETEDTAALLVSLGDRAIGIVETSGAAASPGSRIEVHGSRGWIRAEGTLTGAGRVCTSAGDEARFPEPAPLEPYVAQLGDLAGALRGQPSLGADGPAGAASVAVIAAAVARGTRLGGAATR